jgi:polysaccharide biosynthesis/export protein
VLLVAGCDGLPGSGPSASDITKASRPSPAGETRFALVDVDARITGLMEGWSATSLQGTFGQQRPVATRAIGVGDFVQVVIWEAAAGGLFSAPVTDRAGPGSRTASIPEQAVGPDGAITVPYAGRVRVVGRTPDEVEGEIVRALTGKAIEPQALVTVTKNVANTVTVVGEVTSGARVPLTARGDRLLDVIATAGGTRAPAYETFITLVRDGRSVRIPMQAILTDPSENVFMRPGDVVSVAREPQTFTAAGATGANAVVPFDAIGISLDQAIGRAGGLNDNRADPAGVFVIRYERPQDYDQLGLTRPQSGTTPQIPVIYRVNLRDPNGFFMARRFPVRNKDIVFVSNASLMDLQKVMTILLPFLGVGATAVAVTAATR